MVKNDKDAPVTKGMLDKSLMEAVDTIVQGMDDMASKMATKKDLQRVENKVDVLSVEVSGVKDDVKGLKADLSATVSRKEFQKLKNRVNQYHPQN